MSIGAMSPIASAAPTNSVGASRSRGGLALSAIRGLAGPFAVGDQQASSPSGFAKFAATLATPILVLFGQTDALGTSHAAWDDPSVWVCNRASFQQGYYVVEGYPTLPSVSYYNANNSGSGGPNYATIDTSTYKLNVTPEQLQAKVDAHAERDAQVIANCLHRQGLIRGRGPIGSGLYGGAFTHHELFTDGLWESGTDHYSFTALLRHPDDAALVSRTQSLKTSATPTYRADTPTTLLKLSPTGGIVGGTLQTSAGRAAIEANSIGARPGNFHHLICTNGIAAAKQYVDALRVALKAKCDSYDPPGGGPPVQLCYPACVLHDLENFSGRAAFHSSGYINPSTVQYEPGLYADPPSTGAGYYLTGALWHVMGDFGSPCSTWTTPLYYKGTGFDVPVSYASAISDDPVLELYASYAPALSDSAFPRGAYSPEAIDLHWNRVVFQAADHAIYKAFNEPWLETFPLAQFSNYEFVLVPDQAEPYQRPSSSGVRSIQSVLRQCKQAPVCYGRVSASDPLVKDIKDAGNETATAAAVAAWNVASFNDVVTGVLDKIASAETRDVDAYVYGVYEPWQLQGGLTADGQWGGNAAFFKQLIKELHRRKIYRYVVFSGDLDKTYDAWLEALAEIRSDGSA